MIDYYVGLDVAKVMGLAVWSPTHNRASVIEVEGSPIHQVRSVTTFESLDNEPFTLHYAMELLHNFRNAKTTRSLSERYGYLKYTLIAAGVDPLEVSPRVARSYFDFTTKQEVLDSIQVYAKGQRLTDNHTDALLLALYAGAVSEHQYQVDWAKMDIIVFKKFKEKSNGTR